MVPEEPRLPVRVALACATMLATLVAVLGAGTVQTPPTDVSTSICELRRRHQEMDGKRVRVKAFFATDFQENSVVYDRACPSIAMAFRSKEPKDKSVEQFERALYERLSPFDMDRVFSLEVSGRFVWRPRGKPQGELMVDKVWRFERVRKKTR